MKWISAHGSLAQTAHPPFSRRCWRWATVLACGSALLGSRSRKECHHHDELLNRARSAHLSLNSDEILAVRDRYGVNVLTVFAVHDHFSAIVVAEACYDLRTAFATRFAMVDIPHGVNALGTMHTLSDRAQYTAELQDLPSRKDLLAFACNPSRIGNSIARLASVFTAILLQKTLGCRSGSAASFSSRGRAHRRLDHIAAVRARVKTETLQVARQPFHHLHIERQQVAVVHPPLVHFWRLFPLKILPWLHEGRPPCFSAQYSYSGVIPYLRRYYEMNS